MKILATMLVSALLSSAAVAQPVAAIDAGNFSADPLFRQYIGDYFQIAHALQSGFAAKMMEGMPAEVKAAAPAIPACVNEMQKEMFRDDIFVTPLLTKLQGTGPADREQFAAFTRFLHTSDGARLIALNREANAVSDKPDADGAPQLVSDRDAKLEQMKTLLAGQPKPNQLPQAMFGIGVYMGAMGDDPSADAAMEQAQERAHASAPCQAMETQMAAYQKAHPEAAGKK
jgi:hypothetical protein